MASDFFNHPISTCETEHLIDAYEKKKSAAEKAVAVKEDNHVFQKYTGNVYYEKRIFTHFLDDKGLREEFEDILYTKGQRDIICSDETVEEGFDFDTFEEYCHVSQRTCFIKVGSRADEIVRTLMPASTAAGYQKIQDKIVQNRKNAGLNRD